MTERWKDIPGLEARYQVSDLGRVKSLARSWTDRLGRSYSLHDRILALSAHRSGHLIASFWLDGRRFTRDVHVLVAEAFLPPRPSRAECRHLNGDPADNRWTNLAWGTRRENVHDAISHGTHPRGERNGKARLNGEAARAIFLDDRDPSIVAASYGVVRQTVIDIKNRRTWKHVNAASA